MDSPLDASWSELLVAVELGKEALPTLSRVGSGCRIRKGEQRHVDHYHAFILSRSCPRFCFHETTLGATLRTRARRRTAEGRKRVARQQRRVDGPPQWKYQVYLGAAGAVVRSIFPKNRRGPAVQNREDSRNSSDSLCGFRGSEPTEIAAPSLSAFGFISLIPHRRRRTWRQWARVNLDHAMRNAHAVGDELLGERRRRAAVL
jgi:hypothetical protein